MLRFERVSESMVTTREAKSTDNRQRAQRSYFTPSALLIALIVNVPSGPKPRTWPLMM